MCGATQYWGHATANPSHPGDASLEAQRRRAMTPDAQVLQRRARSHACTDYHRGHIARATHTRDAHSFLQCSLPQPAPACPVPRLRMSAPHKALRTMRANWTTSLHGVSLIPKFPRIHSSTVPRRERWTRQCCEQGHDADHCATLKKDPSVHDASAQQSHCQADK